MGDLHANRAAAKAPNREGGSWRVCEAWGAPWFVLSLKGPGHLRGAASRGQVPLPGPHAPRLGLGYREIARDALRGFTLPSRGLRPGSRAAPGSRPPARAAGSSRGAAPRSLRGRCLLFSASAFVFRRNGDCLLSGREMGGSLSSQKGKQ